jgi:hypothetical protein
MQCSRFDVKFMHRCNTVKTHREIVHWRLGRESFPSAERHSDRRGVGHRGGCMQAAAQGGTYAQGSRLHICGITLADSDGTAEECTSELLLHNPMELSEAFRHGWHGCGAAQIQSLSVRCSHCVIVSVCLRCAARRPAEMISCSRPRKRGNATAWSLYLVIMDCMHSG